MMLHIIFKLFIQILQKYLKYQHFLDTNLLKFKIIWLPLSWALWINLFKKNFCYFTYFINIIVCFSFLEETLYSANKSQLFKCIHYMNDLCDVKERFVKFINVSAHKMSGIFYRFRRSSYLWLQSLKKAQIYNDIPIISVGVSGI